MVSHWRRVPCCYAGMQRASAAALGGVRGRGIAAAGHGGGSSSSSRHPGRMCRRRSEIRSGRRAGATAAGRASGFRKEPRSDSVRAASTASTETGSALQPLRQRKPGAFSRAQASEAQDARIVRLSARDSRGCVSTSRGWRNTSPGATSACHASTEADCGAGGFIGPECERCVSIIDTDHPPWKRGARHERARPSRALEPARVSVRRMMRCGLRRPARGSRPEPLRCPGRRQPVRRRH